MLDDRFESEVKKHAGDIFGQNCELPEGHRERFEQRLKARRGNLMDDNEQKYIISEPEKELDNIPDTETVKQKKGIFIQFEKWFAGAAAVAAVIACFIFLTDTTTEEQDGSRIEDVRNYYSMQLEEQVDATKTLAQGIREEKYRDALLVNIERIESEPVPDVVMPDDDYIVLMANIYTKKIEVLKNIQSNIKDTNK